MASKSRFTLPGLSQEKFQWFLRAHLETSSGTIPN